MTERYVSISVTARELGFNVKTLRRWCSEGRIPDGCTMVTPGGQRRFCVVLLREALKKSGTKLDKAGQSDVDDTA